jgi:ammonium transporter, Amt family
VQVNGANTAWLLVSSALVLLMTPGLALFYGGLNRSKSVLNMMMMSFSSMGLVTVLWVAYGFSLTFGKDVNGLWGSPTEYLGTRTYLAESDVWGSVGVPLYVFLAFQMMFAVITVALISGALSDRTRFSGWLVFAAGWVTLVYFPVAHMVWGGGLIGSTIGALDFAGGTAVHTNAGAAALAAALVAGRRIGWPRESFKPHNVPMVALGAGLLWFGWFGFNAGSGLAADAIAGLTFVTTQVAAASAVLGWLAVEWIRDGKPTMVGASSGAVAGLVAITPACAYVAPYAAAIIGAFAGVVCALAVGLKYRFRYDDSLDVVGVHLVAGWIGSLSIGLFADASASPLLRGVDGKSDTNGLFFGGGTELLGRQALAGLIVHVLSFVVAGALAYLIDKTIGFRAKAETEVEGIDVAEHAESAYEVGLFSGRATDSPTHVSVAIARAAAQRPKVAAAYQAGQLDKR